MSASTIHLIRDCLGMTTRIECQLRPVPKRAGLFAVLCAAGLRDAQPTAVKLEGPFVGRAEAERVLHGIRDNLIQQGYTLMDDIGIWELHMLGELRRYGGAAGVAGHG